MKADVKHNIAAENDEITVNFKMQKNLNKDLKALAKRRGISFAGLMRQLGIAELEKEGKK